MVDSAGVGRRVRDLLSPHVRAPRRRAGHRPRTAGRAHRATTIEDDIGLVAEESKGDSLAAFL